MIWTDGICRNCEKEFLLLLHSKDYVKDGFCCLECRHAYWENEEYEESKQIAAKREKENKNV